MVPLVLAVFTAIGVSLRFPIGSIFQHPLVANMALKFQAHQKERDTLLNKELYCPAHSGAHPWTNHRG